MAPADEPSTDSTDSGPGPDPVPDPPQSSDASLLARLPFVRPDRYFARSRPNRPFVHALVAVAVVTAAIAAGIWVLGGAIAGAVDEAGITVENPDRPDDVFCDDGESSSEFTPDGCDAPERVPAGAVFRDAIGQFVAAMLFGLPVIWFLTGVGLHLLATLANGDGALTDSLSVAAWGMVPSIGVGSLNLALLVWLLEHHRFEAATLPAFTTEFQSLLGGQWGLAFGAVSALGLTWAAVVHFHGLREALDLSGPAAATAAALVWVVFALFGLA